MSDLLSRAGSKAGRLQRAALAELRKKEADGVLPTNTRFLFYELEHAGLVRKSEPGESRRLRGFPAGQQDLIDAIFYLREKGIIPWGWITDETRILTVWDHAPSVAVYMRDRLEEATINPWEPEPPPLILVESRSLGGVLRRIAGAYSCPIAPTNGQAGGFLRTEVAPHLATDERRRILYLGDLDHQGAQIETNTRRVLEREAGRSFDWRRIALTQAQVDEHSLEPIWKKDSRYKPALEHWAWECEDLGQKRVMDLLRAELDRSLPEPLADVLERERAERSAAAAALHAWDGTA